MSTRNHQISAAVTEKERRLIERAAKVAGLTTSELVRTAALSAVREVALGVKAERDRNGDESEREGARA